MSLDKLLFTLAIGTSSADGVLTERAIAGAGAGFEEANPLFGDSLGQRVAVRCAMTGSTVFIAKKLSGWKRRTVLLISIGASSYALQHNLRALHRRE